jgi:hypothetical protein
MSAKSCRRARRGPSVPEVESPGICISCAARGRERSCNTCERLKTKTLRERVDISRETLAAEYRADADWAFRRQMLEVQRRAERLGEP